jgi:putative FmdB family regulatory protein
MPLYTFTCMQCDKDEERIVKIAERDCQRCERCGNRLIRPIDFQGGVYAPTSGKGLAV